VDKTYHDEQMQKHAAPATTLHAKTVEHALTAKNPISN
jgi:hypothetical protein